MGFSRVVRDWAILCPGPSLAAVKSVDCDAGGLIAVNGAVIGTPWIPDFWAVLDPEVFATVNRRFDMSLISKKATLWTFHNFNHFAMLPMVHPDWGGWTQKEKDAYKKFTVITFDTDLEKQMPFGSQLPWRVCTMFASIALAVIQGAKHIRIYGADLSGTGYFQEGFENNRTNHRESRWEYERLLLDEIIFACGNQEIEITKERG